MLSHLSLTYRLAVTLLLLNLVLGLLFLHVKVSHAVRGNDESPGISMEDLRMHFQGDPTVNRLQFMMRGPMHDKFATADEYETIVDWIAQGATREDYESDVAPILAQRCVSCHGPDGERSDSPLTSYEQVLRYAQTTDTGISYDALADASHLYLVSLSCMATLMGLVFYTTRWHGRWKGVLIALPLFCASANVLSWWSAKQSDFFTWLVYMTGLVYGLTMLAMILLTVIDLWVLAEERPEPLPAAPIASRPIPSEVQSTDHTAGPAAIQRPNAADKVQQSPESPPPSA
ncbi:MAG: hypothetical protein N3D11_13870 [Candidatus Sumerlaeia bacterium]|nr:hypothetical protein [Candidatus Sumerlaeia bacterium]